MSSVSTLFVRRNWILRGETKYPQTVETGESSAFAVQSRKKEQDNGHNSHRRWPKRCTPQGVPTLKNFQFSFMPWLGFSFLYNFLPWDMECNFVLSCLIYTNSSPPNWVLKEFIGKVSNFPFQQHFTNFVFFGKCLEVACFWFRERKIREIVTKDSNLL